LNIPERVRSVICEYSGGGGNWLANWPLNSPRKLGEVGTVSAGMFVYSGQSGLVFDVDEAVVRRDSWEYLDSDGSSVDVGFDATVPGWRFIGPAKAGIKANFATANSVYLSVQESYVERVKDIDKLRRTLLSGQLNDRFPIGSAIVVERLVADKVLLLASRSAKSSFKATASGNVAPDLGSKASLAGRLSAVGSNAGVDMEQYSRGPVILAVRAAILVQSGWLWWRRISVNGFDRMTSDQVLKLLELTSKVDDWIVRF
jgi:hypothetical protein